MASASSIRAWASSREPVIRASSLDCVEPTVSASLDWVFSTVSAILDCASATFAWVDPTVSTSLVWACSLAASPRSRTSASKAATCPTAVVNGFSLINYSLPVDSIVFSFRNDS